MDKRMSVVSLALAAALSLGACSKHHSDDGATAGDQARNGAGSANADADVIVPENDALANGDDALGLGNADNALVDVQPAPIGNVS